MSSVAEQLEKLAALLKEGLISREQFEAERDQLFSRSSSIQSGPGVVQGQIGRPEKVGAYDIVDVVGEGGMGAVYRGRHMSPSIRKRQGGDVAVKVMHSLFARNETYRQRFEAEAEHCLNMSHPGIVKAHDLVLDAGFLALVMEYVPGRPLSTIIGTETGPMPWERAEPLFLQLLEAIGYAHSQGVIHRDLKPENVIVTAEGAVKVLDFGIAKAEDSSKTRTGTRMGTADYMAPEQWEDASSADVRADIYSLGMTLYEMLAGRLPWDPSTREHEVYLLKKDGNIPPPSDFYPPIPAELVAIVRAALQAQPGDRHPSTQAFAEALAAAGGALTQRYQREEQQAAERRQGDGTPPPAERGPSQTLVEEPGSGAGAKVVGHTEVLAATPPPPAATAPTPRPSPPRVPLPGKPSPLRGPHPRDKLPNGTVVALGIIVLLLAVAGVMAVLGGGVYGFLNPEELPSNEVAEATSQAAAAPAESAQETPPVGWTIQLPEELGDFDMDAVLAAWQGDWVVRNQGRLEAWHVDGQGLSTYWKTRERSARLDLFSPCKAGATATEHGGVFTDNVTFGIVEGRLLVGRTGVVRQGEQIAGCDGNKLVYFDGRQCFLFTSSGPAQDRTWGYESQSATCRIGTKPGYGEFLFYRTEGMRKERSFRLFGSAAEVEGIDGIDGLLIRHPSFEAAKAALGDH